jgi:tetratricopeptide (TPR) repeat protein
MSLLDGLSLAIVIAGAFMRETGTNLKEYLELYQTSWFDLQSESRPTRHYQQGNMVQTWIVTYQELQKRDQIAAKLLLLLCCFDTQDIWYELVHCGSNCSNRPPWFDTAISSKLAFKSKMKALIGLSLVETKQQEGSYTIHPVVQEWCTHIAASDELTQELHELTLISVGYMVPSKTKRDYTRLQQRLLPHARHLASKERNNWQHGTTDIWNALSGIGNLYSDQGKLKEAERMYQQALAGKEKALGSNHIFTLDTIHHLGTLYSHQGKLKDSENMYQQALRGREKALGLDHTSTLDTIHCLGLLYRAWGKLDKAEEMYQNALAGYKNALGPDHTSILNTVNNLGNLYRDQGKLKEAEDMYDQALAGYKEALGPDHTYTLYTVNNLGNLYWDQGKLKEAEEMYLQALAGKERALSPDHPF